MYRQIGLNQMSKMVDKLYTVKILKIIKENNLTLYNKIIKELNKDYDEKDYDEDEYFNRDYLLTLLDLSVFICKYFNFNISYNEIQSIRETILNEFFEDAIFDIVRIAVDDYINFEHICSSNLKKGYEIMVDEAIEITINNPIIMYPIYKYKKSFNNLLFLLFHDKNPGGEYQGISLVAENNSGLLIVTGDLSVFDIKLLIRLFAIMLKCHNIKKEELNKNEFKECGIFR